MMSSPIPPNTLRASWMALLKYYKDEDDGPPWLA
jgi:hypothetical protein